MRTNIQLLLPGVALCLYVACGSPAPKPAGDNRETQSVRAVLNEAIQAFNRGDVETYMAAHTDDAIVMAPGRRPQVGKEAIRTNVEKLFQTYNVRETRAIDEVTISGDWAFVRGWYDSAVTPKLSGSPGHDTGNYIDILRQEHGKWKYARSIWNSAVN